MCGLFAMFLRRPLSDGDIVRGRRATLDLAHRGPDGSGEFIDREAGVFLGHRRLSIIDLSDLGAQPMSRGRDVIVYNGELYGFEELRERLVGLGCEFRSSSDTEVLLNAWQQWGLGCLNFVDGMFSFVVWDGNKAYAATDPFGEKPLYYYENLDGTYFSSEIEPIASALGLDHSVGSFAVTSMLALGSIPAPHTAYPGVRRLDAASSMIVASGRAAEPVRYWRPVFGDIGDHPPREVDEKQLDTVEEALTESLSNRLTSDVPMGLFLSSGVDSSLIAAIAKRSLGKELPCITVSFPTGRATNEAPHAKQIAEHLKLPHEILVSGTVTEQGPEQIISLFGQPNDNITAMSVREMSRLGRTKFKVAMTGTGGDELFFGYRKHYQMYRFRRLMGIPEPLRVAGGEIAHRFRFLNPKLGPFADIVGLPSSELYLAQKTNGIIRWLRELPDWGNWVATQFEPYRRYPLMLLGPQYDLERTLPDSILPAQDLGSMREGLELRTPFLSRKLLATLAEFDPRSALAFGRKSLLNRIIQRHLPSSLTHGNKIGFIFPTDRFIEALPTPTPKIPGIRDTHLSTAWRRRGSGDGWHRLAIRMSLTATFIEQDKLRTTT